MTQLQQSLLTLHSKALGGMENARREEGQTLAEYALILALIAAAVAVAVIFLRDQINSLFSQIGTEI